MEGENDENKILDVSDDDVHDRIDIQCMHASGNH